METEGRVEHFIRMFPNKGTIVQKGRNTIKKIKYKGRDVSVKSFKQPHFFNSFVYKYFRKSKAKRSFLYAKKLLSLGIGTPKPLGYLQNTNLFGIKDSYYVCEHLNSTLELREVLSYVGFPDKENIMEQYAGFMFELHQKGIEFIDSTPGNILLEKESVGKYRFYLIDINRMKFHKKPLSFVDRMKNLSKLTEETPVLHQIERMYAKFYKQDTEYIYQTLLYYRSRYNIWMFHKQYFKYQVSLFKKMFVKPVPNV